MSKDNQEFCTGDLDTNCEDCQCCEKKAETPKEKSFGHYKKPSRVWRINCAKNGESIKSRIFKGSLNEFINNLERDVLIIGIPEDISSQVGHVSDVMEQMNNLSPSPME